MVAMASSPDSRFVVRQSQQNDPTLSTSPSISAFRVGSAARASGRRAVRFITLSISASATQLSVLAPPAASIPPINVLRISSGFTWPRSASSIAGIAVTNSSSMTRGLVSATYANTVPRTRLGAMRPRTLTQ